MTGLDPKDPLVIDVRTILQRRAGSMVTVTRSVPAPAGLGVAMARVPEGSPIDLDLRLESVLEGVLVTGSADLQVSAECSRCLETVRLARGDRPHRAVPIPVDRRPWRDRRGGGRVRGSAAGTPGRSDRPGAGAAGRGGAGPATRPAVQRGLPRPVPPVRGAAGGRSAARARDDRSPVGGPGRTRRPGRSVTTQRPSPRETPRPKEVPCPFRSGRRPVPTPVTAVRSGRPPRRLS